MKIKIGAKGYLFLFTLLIYTGLYIGIVYFGGWVFIPKLLAYGSVFCGIVCCIVAIAGVIDAYRKDVLEIYEFTVPIPERYVIYRRRKEWRSQLLDLRKEMQTLGYEDPLKLARYLEKEKVLEDLLFDPTPFQLKQ